MIEKHSSSCVCLLHPYMGFGVKTNNNLNLRSILRISKGCSKFTIRLLHGVGYYGNRVSKLQNKRSDI